MLSCTAVFVTSRLSRDFRVSHVVITARAGSKKHKFQSGNSTLITLASGPQFCWLLLKTGQVGLRPRYGVMASTNEKAKTEINPVCRASGFTASGSFTTDSKSRCAALSHVHSVSRLLPTRFT